MGYDKRLEDGTYFPNDVVTDQYPLLTKPLEERGYEAFVFERYNPITDSEIPEGRVVLLGMGKKHLKYVSFDKLMLEDVEFVDRYISDIIIKELDKKSK